MSELNTYSRLKVKRDTFYLPDPQGGVYFRNNQSSFRLEGGTIYQWIEKLMPMFNGEQSLEHITEGLTPPYRNRVYEIGETLYKNGFVRDVSQDHPHQLNSSILEKYGSQIEFIENFVDSGPYRFQQYRQSKVLAVGSGSFLVSLADALLESGLPKFHFMMTDSVPANEVRIHELVQNARNDDSEVMVEQIPYHSDGGNFWQEAVKPYDWILYISQDGNEKELRELNRVCKEERKVFVPAICLDQVGLAGPVVHPESEGCWESAWRRIHQSFLQLDRQQPSSSGTAGAILAHVMVFEFFKKAVDIADSNQSTQFYNLNLETLEGDWISFIPHPLVANYDVSPRLLEDLDVGLEQEESEKDPNHNLLEYFNLLTSVETGIFHIWEERDLKQLPLSQCYVQAVNPVSEGPATLLPEVICSGLTHEEARREAGLTGIEMYVSQMIKELTDRKNSVNIHNRFMGVGAGETIEEAVCRGLQAYIDEELRQRKANHNSTIYQIPLGSIEDQQCRLYLNALTTLNGAPTIGLKEDILGFPVIGVRSNGRWYTRAGLNTALALRYSLQQALLDAQNELNVADREMESAVFLKEKKFKLEIPSCAEITKLELLQSSLQVLNRRNKQLFIYDLAFEPFLKQGLAGVYGVQVREGES
ncbi:putative thiazole-containing bacteriocin maturation protein [Paenibacillus sp. BSR1-1]|uniref:putative thiazole-containing bacteriocin maturation protein n=1 Tax=Paenibacillus sp. BSR1-1 TaxID=3020845 RepID=UPI0025B27F1B|nr:putative thiazole-containing bacteriocin maturation protein [Paenibacillus sp. BSR1-1]MDN3015654.1 putative thiazole-containing bacteriocin maturation protein [Paenibacillus sp. BSR1-1]